MPAPRSFVATGACLLFFWLSPQTATAADDAQPSSSAATSSAVFKMGALDLRLHSSFNSSSMSPLGIITSIVGWNELAAGVDFGILGAGGYVVGIGAEAYYDRPWLAELLFEGLWDLSYGSYGGDFDVDVWNTGLLGRGTFHLNGADFGMKSVDPYALGLLGPTYSFFKVQWTDEQGASSRGEVVSAGMRGGAGIGANFVSAGGVFASLELRYLLAFNFSSQASIDVKDQQGETLLVYEDNTYQQPPRGFSWVVSLGYRVGSNSR